MKYIKVIAVATFFLATLIASGQENSTTVPKAVENSFKAKYPGENDPDWEKDSNGYWEASFKKKGERYRADFNVDGTWIETENSIKYKNLPKAIRKVVEKKYSDMEISEVEHVMSASKGEFYDVEFKQKGKNKDIEFRKDGSIL